MGSLLYTVTLQGFIIILSHCLLARGASKGDGVYHNRLQAKSDRRKSRDPDYDVVRTLHHNMDTNHDGDLEEEDTKVFIEKTLHQQGLSRVKGERFHRYDAHITVEDLLVTWHNSEVYHWTEDDLVHWLCTTVGLPQYEQKLRELEYNGTILPWIATNNLSVFEKLGITDVSDRQRMQLKAIDVVLFGTPKYASRNILIDIVLVGFATCCAVGLWWTWRTKREAERELDLVMSHMKAAEEDLKKLQDRLAEQDIHMVQRSKSSLSDLMSSDHHDGNQHYIRSVSESYHPSKESLSSDIEELMSKKNILEQEVDSLQNMSDLFYLLLQQTYRKEKTHWEEMKKEAEKELHVARKECEKLHKKKSSIFSSLKLSHSSTLHDTDMKIHHAIITLKEVTEGLEEFAERWRSIERICSVQLGESSDTTEANLGFETATAPLKRKFTRQADIDSGRTSTQSSLDSAYLSRDPTCWSIGSEPLRSETEQDSQTSEGARTNSPKAAVPQRSQSSVVPSSYAVGPVIPSMGSEPNFSELIDRVKDTPSSVIEGSTRKGNTLPNSNKKQNYLSRVSRVNHDSLPSISEGSPQRTRRANGVDELKSKSLQSAV